MKKTSLTIGKPAETGLLEGGVGIAIAAATVELLPAALGPVYIH